MDSEVRTNLDGHPGFSHCIAGVFASIPTKTDNRKKQPGRQTSPQACKLIRKNTAIKREYVSQSS